MKFVDVTITVTYKASKHPNKIRDAVHVSTVCKVPEKEAREFKQAWQRNPNGGFRLKSLENGENILYNLDAITGITIESC